MENTFNFILSKYYEKLTDLQRRYSSKKKFDIAFDTTEEGQEELKEIKIEIEVYKKIIYDMENIKSELENFLK